MREHNRIARELKIKLENEGFFEALSPTEKDECIYQESRRILIAEVAFPIDYEFKNIFPQFQNIVYHEYLPIVVGPKMMQDYRLNIGNGLTKYKYK